MLSPLNGEGDLHRLSNALLTLWKKPAIASALPPLPRPRRALSVREAVFAPSELLPVAQCCGRICAEAAINCPPAVPIVVCGEEIDAHSIECFRYYGVETCRVVKEA